MQPSASPPVGQPVIATLHHRGNCLQVDDNSWPLQSLRYPNLTVTAYAPDAIYTHEDVAALARYAFERGITIVPEFDGGCKRRSAWDVCMRLAATHACRSAAYLLLMQCLPTLTRGPLRCLS